jgi:Uma2 family endonuclease
MPPPSERHGVICSLIAHLLWTFVIRRGKGYVCSNDTGLIVKTNPDTVRGPDLMLFEESRSLAELSLKFAKGIPTLVVEVLSPTDQISKVLLRISQYLQRGVPLIWLVDPEVQTVTIYQAGKEHRVLDETDELTGNSVLPDFQYRVSDLFALPNAPKPL